MSAVCSMDGRAERGVGQCFSIRNWNVGPCIGQVYREWGFFLRPSGREDAVVRPAKLDGVRGIFLVPENRKAPHYQKGKRRPRGRSVLPIDEEAARALVQHISSLGAEVLSRSSDEVII